MFFKLLAATLAIAPAAIAATPNVLLIDHGAKAIYTGPVQNQNVLPRWTPLANRIVVINTLGKKPYKYNADSGATVSGTKSGVPTQWYAQAIVPTKTVTLTEIIESVSNAGGTNSVTLALYSDAKGVPGTILEQKTVSNLEKFGGCCTVAVDHVKSSIQLTAGTTYWVAAILPSKTQVTAFDVWNQSSVVTNSVNQAYYVKNTWFPTSDQALGLAVFGK